MLNSYIGRFAPSPTGPLHFGSLLAAVASYLQAKNNQGKWLVRIEDIDPPREVKGSASGILKQLEQHGLVWDDSVVYQSDQIDQYHDVLQKLRNQNLVYSCTCTRQRISELNGIYDGLCSQKNHPLINASSRFSINRAVHAIGRNNDKLAFTDSIMGEFSQSLNNDVGDFVVLRRDGLISYQLAVVIDDFYQGITEIVRGYDLIDSTPRQILLQKCLDYPTPGYAHIPLAINALGQKLSKQHFAKALTVGNESEQLWLALDWLQQNPPKALRQSSIKEILSWATAHWALSSIPKLETGVAAPKNL
jgi:glutamyl-Q tRNA(Asp) synthetase